MGRHLPGVVTLDHGGGGGAGEQLLRELLLPHLRDPELARLEDSALIDLAGVRLALTTDGYVVDPPVFPGGDLGMLAVHGTVNDLAVRGARPVAMTLGLILEEGVELDLLERVAASAARAAEVVGVRIVAGDTKVVPRGKGGGIFVTTSGVGVVESEEPPSVHGVEPGDLLLVSGPVGRHGMAVMAARAGVELGPHQGSDTAPLWGLVEAMMEAAGGGIHALRDPTRGGLATVLVEMAQASQVALEVEEAAVPVDGWVEELAGLMGLDPLYLANEGRLVAAVAPDAADAALEAMHRHPLGREGVVIGRALPSPAGRVVCITSAGGRRPLRRLHGNPTHRIC